MPSTMRDQRSRGASPETIAAAPAACDEAGIRTRRRRSGRRSGLARRPRSPRTRPGPAPSARAPRRRMPALPNQSDSSANSRRPRGPQGRQDRDCGRPLKTLDQSTRFHSGTSLIVPNSSTYVSYQRRMPLDRRQEGADLVLVADVAVQVVHAVDPVQRPVRDGHALAGLDLADDAHRQHAVVARRVAEGDVVAGQRPVVVRGQVHHLVDDAVADPGALLAGRAVGVRVEGVHRHRAPAGQIERVDLGVVRAEEGVADLGVVVLAHPDAGDRHLAGVPV